MYSSLSENFIFVVLWWKENSLPQISKSISDTMERISVFLEVLTIQTVRVEENPQKKVLSSKSDSFYISHVYLCFWGWSGVTCVETLTEWLGEKSSFSCLRNLKNSWYFDNFHLNFLKDLLTIPVSYLQK